MATKKKTSVAVKKSPVKKTKKGGNELGPLSDGALIHIITGTRPLATKKLRGKSYRDIDLGPLNTVIPDNTPTQINVSLSPLALDSVVNNVHVTANFYSVSPFGYGNYTLVRDTDNPVTNFFQTDTDLNFDGEETYSISRSGDGLNLTFKLKDKTYFDNEYQGDTLLGITAHGVAGSNIYTGAIFFTLIVV